MSALLPDNSPRSPSADTAIDHRIRRRIEENVHYYAVHPEEIDARLAELDREWDIERVLEANAAGIAVGGMLLGLFRHRGFLALPLIAAGFLLQHALQGSGVPARLLRRRGVRTAVEIASERAALKSLRGDFAAVERMPNAPERANAAFRAALA
ncbi:MAG TPA: hypothetical protein VK741_15165 [Acetobacteraceae bacterium]|nr:hypothetical protein [Acetobacteraceae bacterium]